MGIFSMKNGTPSQKRWELYTKRWASVEVLSLAGILVFLAFILRHSYNQLKLLVQSKPLKTLTDNLDQHLSCAKGTNNLHFSLISIVKALSVLNMLANSCKWQTALNCLFLSLCLTGQLPSHYKANRLNQLQVSFLAVIYKPWNWLETINFSACLSLAKSVAAATKLTLLHRTSNSWDGLQSPTIHHINLAKSSLSKESTISSSGHEHT